MVTGVRVPWFRPLIVCGVPFSVASRKSFEAVSFIHDKLLTNLLGTTDAVARVLIGNKSDIASRKYGQPRSIQ